MRPTPCMIGQVHLLVKDVYLRVYVIPIKFNVASMCLSPDDYNYLLLMTIEIEVMVFTLAFTLNCLHMQNRCTCLDVLECLCGTVYCYLW